MAAQRQVAVAAPFLSTRTGWYALLGVSGGFITYYLTMLFFMAAAVAPRAGWDPLYFMLSSEPHTLLMLSMPVLFAVSVRTVSRRHQIDRRYLVMAASVGAVHYALLMFWPFTWWVPP